MVDTTTPKPKWDAEIEWDGPTETWTLPFTAEQRARLSTAPAFVDGITCIVAVGPDAPDCVHAMPADFSWMDDGDAGDTYKVRFGRMPLTAYEALPEHEGW
jgi:hypothetical protein